MCVVRPHRHQVKECSDKALAPILERFTSVTVLDSSTITLPDSMQEEFAGCGGSYGGGAAAMKLQTVSCRSRITTARIWAVIGRAPSGEMLGGLLLGTGDPSAAERIFREELTRNPRSGRALFGLSACLKAQGKTYAAQSVEAEFKAAWKNADFALLTEDL